MNRRKGKNLSAYGSLAACCFLWLAPTLAAQDHARAIVIREIKHGVSPPLRDLVSASTVETQDQHSLNVAAATPLVSTNSVIDFPGLAAPQGNLNGIPDVNGAVGPTQFVQWINTYIGIFDKTTGALVQKNSGSHPWKGFGPPCQGPSDTIGLIVQYDKLASRWVFTHAGKSGTTYAQCVAVSTTSDATGTYNLYAFQLSATVGGPPLLPINIKLGVWPDAYYVGTDTSAGALACALDRNSMLAGLTASAQCFVASTKLKGLLPSDLDGATLPPTGSPNYFFSLGATALNMWQFHVDFTTPSNSTLSGPTKIAIQPYQPACPGGKGVCIPQLDTSQVLNSNSDRLMYRAAYRNFPSAVPPHESIVLNHTVNPPTEAWAGIRWYEIRSPGTTPVVFQQETYSPDTISRWVGSIAMDQLGDIALGYSASDVTIHPAIRYTGRTPADGLNSLEPEASIIEGEGSQQCCSYAWGAYTSLVIDPTDDCTFWYTNEYYQADSVQQWVTEIGAFNFSSCPSSQ